MARARFIFLTSGKALLLSFNFLKVFYGIFY